MSACEGLENIEVDIEKSLLILNIYNNGEIRNSVRKN